jgi:hypothetical protein
MTASVEYDHDDLGSVHDDGSRDSIAIGFSTEFSGDLPQF